jgi:hypothetical protein
MIEINYLKRLSTGEHTYCPSDWNELLDLVDFCVTKGIPQVFAVAKSCFDLSSDHSLVFITLKAHALNHEKQTSLSNRHINWDDFRHLFNQRLTSNVSLQIEEDIEAAVKFFNDTVQWAGWITTPQHTDTFKAYSCPMLIKQKTKKKEDSVEIGTRKAKDYLTQQHMNSNKSLITTKMIASKHSWKV